MPIGTPTCFYVAEDTDSGNCVFIFEDLCLRNGLYGVNQFAGNGCERLEAECVAISLGKLHAQYWSWADDLPTWLPHTNDIKARDIATLVKDCQASYFESAFFLNLDEFAQTAVRLLMP